MIEDLAGEKSDRFSRNTGQEENIIKRVIDELQEAVITHHNFKDFVNKVKSRIEIIEAQISNILTKFDRDKESYNNYKSNEQIKTLIRDDKVVPIRVFHLQTSLFNYLQELMVWKTYEVEMLTIIFNKLEGAISVVKAFDIEREVLQNMRKLQNDNLDFIKEYVTQTQQNIEKRFDEYRDSVNGALIAIQTRTDDKLIYTINNLRETVEKVIDGKTNWNIDDTNTVHIKDKSFKKQKVKELEVDEIIGEVEKIDIPSGWKATTKEQPEEVYSSPSQQPGNKS